MSENRFNIKYPFLNSMICYKGNNWNRYYDDYPDEQDKLISNSNNFIESKKENFPKVFAYFNGSLHDSEVIDVIKEDDKCTLILNDFSSHCFVDALCDIENIKIPHKQREQLLEIYFEQINKFTIARLNNNQKIIPINFSKTIPYLGDYLYSEIKELENGKINLGILFTTSKHHNYVLIEIICKKITFSEKQKESFLKIFPPEFLVLYQKFETNRINGEYFDYSIAKEMIEKLKLPKNGIEQ